MKSFILFSALVMMASAQNGLMGAIASHPLFSIGANINGKVRARALQGVGSNECPTEDLRALATCIDPNATVAPEDLEEFLQGKIDGVGEAFGQLATSSSSDQCAAMDDAYHVTGCILNNDCVKKQLTASLLMDFSNVYGLVCYLVNEHLGCTSTCTGFNKVPCEEEMQKQSASCLSELSITENKRDTEMSCAVLDEVEKVMDCLNPKCVNIGRLLGHYKEFVATIGAPNMNLPDEKTGRELCKKTFKACSGKCNSVLNRVFSTGSAPVDKFVSSVVLLVAGVFLYPWTSH